MSNLSEEILTVLVSNYPEPMHYKDITDELIKAGFWSQSPKTPAKTVSSALTSEINKNGPESLFHRVGEKGSGVYAVNSNYITVQDTTPKKSIGATVSFFLSAVIAGAVVVGLYVAANAAGLF